MKITEIEKNILALIYIGTIETENLAIELGVSNKKIEKLKKGILIKLGVNNWHDAILKSFKRKILVKSDFFDNRTGEETSRKTNILRKINDNSNNFKVPVIIEFILALVLWFKK